VRRADRQPYHLHVLIVLKSGSLNLLEPSEPVQACNGIAFFFSAKGGSLARSLWLFLSPHSPGHLREVTGDWRKLHEEELHDFCSLPNNILVIRLRRMAYGV